MKSKLIALQYVYYFNPNSILINDTNDFFNNLIKRDIFKEYKKPVNFNNLFVIPEEPILKITDSNNNLLKFQEQRCDFIFKEKENNDNLNIEKFKNTCNRLNDFLIEKKFVINRLGAIATFENSDFVDSNEMLNTIKISTYIKEPNTFNLFFGEEYKLENSKIIYKYTRFIKQEKSNKLIMQKDFNSGINNNNQQLSNEFISLFKTNFFDELIKKEW